VWEKARLDGDRQLQRGEPGFDFGESGFEGFAADRARRTFVENAIALEFESLPLEGACCAGGWILRFLSGAGRWLGRTLLDLLFDGFAFPSSGHTPMVVRIIRAYGDLFAPSWDTRSLWLSRAV
jgi:hypothetical protein